MLELIGLFLAPGLIMRTARRRGGEKWLWLAVGLSGYIAIAFAFFRFSQAHCCHLPADWPGLVGADPARLLFPDRWNPVAGMTWQCDA